MIYRKPLCCSQSASCSRPWFMDNSNRNLISWPLTKPNWGEARRVEKKLLLMLPTQRRSSAGSAAWKPPAVALKLSSNCAASCAVLVVVAVARQQAQKLSRNFWQMLTKPTVTATWTWPTWDLTVTVQNGMFTERAARQRCEHGV